VSLGFNFRVQVSIILNLLVCQVFASAEIPDFFKKWEQDPRSAALELPSKVGSPNRNKFQPKELRDLNFLSSKDQSRLKICEMGGQDFCESPFSVFAKSEDLYFAKSFTGNDLETNIYRLDGFKQGFAQIKPWSGYYWPAYEGGIGARYADTKFPRGDSFLSNFKYYKKNYHKNSTQIKSLDSLAPSEKYDLVWSDKDWSLTYYSWAVGRRSYQLTGEVESWMGICHGWAPAAINVPEPKKAFDVEIPGLDKKVRIYPNDVKALVSQLWAQAKLGSRFIGGRCNDKNPEVDSVGRIITKDCFDVNPASWHLVLLNLMGKQKQSFVFDAIYDYEVWNQPISSYEFKYFNPVTHQVSNDMGASLIPYLSFVQDPFRKYRDPKTSSVVGIELMLKYVVESDPYQGSPDSVQTTRETQVKYYYDLELDSDFNVIGGEWYQLAHPDMMWKPSIPKPLAMGEIENDVWNGRFPLPTHLFPISLEATKLNQPLSFIINKWIELSK
jgi:hypothetical protein